MSSGRSPLQTTQELGERIQYFLSHEDERRRMVRAAYELAVGRHTWDERAKFISAVAQRAMDTHPPGAP